MRRSAYTSTIGRSVFPSLLTMMKIAGAVTGNLVMKLSGRNAGVGDQGEAVVVILVGGRGKDLRGIE